MDVPTKNQLIHDLEISFQETIDWVNAQPESHFNETIVPEKWTIAGHIYHLIKSTKAVTAGLVMPRLVLKTMFGKNNRTERTYDEMVEKYKSTLIKNNVKAPSMYAVKADRKFEKAALIKRFEDELNDFVNALEKWKESDLSVYVLPHPVIGKCTLREFVHFTTLHTYHHLNNLKTNYVK